MKHANVLAMGIWKRISEAFMPRQCAICRHRLLDSESLICSECAMQLPVIALEGTHQDNNLARLFWGFFPIEGAATAYRYVTGGVMSGMVHNMKYGNQALLCQFAGQLMTMNDMVMDVLKDADALIPVPLTVARQRERGYNQAEQICIGISHETQLPIITDAIIRIKFTESQTAMTSAERIENIKGAFVAGNTQQIEGKHIVIVDDIITTGATVSECILQLRDIPNLRISVLSFAWTH